MEIVKLTESLYGEWDAFCAASDDAWFWHTSAWLELTHAYKPERHSEQLSFFVEEGGKTLAICPLFLETHGARKEFSFGGGGLPTPALMNGLSKKAKVGVLRFIFSHLDTLAVKEGVSRVEFRFPVRSPRQPEANYLPRFGFLDTSLLTQVIDTSRPLAELRSGLRHGHDADVARAAKSLALELFTDETVTPEAFDAYRTMHARAAGRVTRPERTFDIQYELIKNGSAFLAAAKKDGEFAGFSYGLLYKRQAYYASACNDPRFSKLPIGHFLQWESIKYLHECGIETYEIGWQRFMPSLSGIWSEKELRISKFMRGFGGAGVPLFRGEKYYDAAYFLEVYGERLKKSAEAITQHEKTT